jgi:hypothetical protein
MFFGWSLAHKSTQSYLEGVLRLGNSGLPGIVCFENFDGFVADFSGAF